MYYRRKILLALLESFEGKLDKISLQKLLLLVSKNQDKPCFQFVPYKYGCYSFQANADLQTLSKYQQVSLQGNEWVKVDNEKYLPILKEKDKQAIRSVKQLYGNKSGEELMRITYLMYPQLAINSIVAKKLLTQDEYVQITRLKPHSDETILFTIGYEGVSLEEYINKLISNDVKVLCDVRKNSYSMKFGFSKSQLLAACSGVGIEFIHIPQLGIESDKRQQLTTQADYDDLFLQYRTEILSRTQEYQNMVIELLIEKKRVALTCFEANICQCHRKHLAETIEKHQAFKYQLKHI